ncbi:MAG: hypothetical protein K0B52_06835, partial [FCB group bacterium]|nr:hypothetical protein [FCB group bacterium]
MKKILPFFLALILAVIVFSGCDPLFPVDKDQFDLNDTVRIAIGEKLYENERLWIRLEKITFDSRCPAGMQSEPAGHVEGQFTVGGWGNRETLAFRTDSLRSPSFMVPFDNISSGGRYYILNIIDVIPLQTDSETAIPKEDYRVDFVLEAGDVAKKPNIYLYPEKTVKLDVSLFFPHGGEVIESDPQYPEDWKGIRVRPDGRIVRKYD